MDYSIHMFVLFWWGSLWMWFIWPFSFYYVLDSKFNIFIANQDSKYRICIRWGIFISGSRILDKCIGDMSQYQASISYLHTLQNDNIGRYIICSVNIKKNVANLILFPSVGLFGNLEVAHWLLGL